MMNSNMEALNDNMMAQAAGGRDFPSNSELKEMGLWKYVQNREIGWNDNFYDTWREETGTWKHVGSGDMLKYVERTLGADDPRYKKVYNMLNDDDDDGYGYSM